jgi:hypothetical protein
MFPVQQRAATTANSAWKVAILIALAAGIVSAPLNRSTTENALERSVTQISTVADEDELVW